MILILIFLTVKMRILDDELNPLKEKKFISGYAGMPFPPFMMTGPHFSKKYWYNINILPHHLPKTKELYE